LTLFPLLDYAGNTMSTWKYLPAALFIILAPGLTAGTLSLAFYQHAADNIFQNRSAVSDGISALSLSWDKEFSPFSLFAGADYSYLSRNPSLSFFNLDLGADYLHAFNKKTAFHASLSGTGIFFREDAEDYNHASLLFNSTLKTYLNDASILRANYRLEYRKYGYSLFDFLSHALTLSFDRFFRTKTTLKCELVWGNKDFLHPFEASAAEADAAGYQYGKGRGRGGTRPAPAWRSQSQGRSLRMVSLSLLAAQNLWDRAGVNILFQRQWTISGENPFASIEEFYMIENPTYDAFSWEGWAAGSNLTLEIPWDIEWKVGYNYSERSFPGIESLNLDGTSLGVVRNDKRHRWETRLEKNFPGFSLFISFSRIRNASTDLFFDWDGRFLQAGIAWSLTLGEKR